MADTAPDPVAEARRFAIQQHTALGQQHGEGRPYWFHLDECDEVRQRFGYTNRNLAAAVWLHDVIEDCGVDRDQLRGLFGARVAQLAWAVSDEPGHPNRRQRKAATLPKIAATKSATAIKLIDRIANYEQCLRAGRVDLARMYRDEQDALREALHVPSEHEALWQHLDALMLRSAAPAGEGDFIPSGRYGMGGRDAKRDRALVRQLLAGEGDELLRLGGKVVYGRVGAYVVEQGQSNRGKVSINVSFRGDAQNAAVEFARMLPNKVSRWMRPLTVH